MTNYNYYIDGIMKEIGVNRKTGEVINCKLTETFDCKDCIFNDVECWKKGTKKAWLESEYRPVVDWSKVKIDTPIYVKAHWDDEWIPRYFAEYLDGEIYAWNDGKTSFTTTAGIPWNYAKLAVEEESATDE